MRGVPTAARNGIKTRHKPGFVGEQSQRKSQPVPVLIEQHGTFGVRVMTDATTGPPLRSEREGFGGECQTCR